MTRRLSTAPRRRLRSRLPARRSDHAGDVALLALPDPRPPRLLADAGDSVPRATGGRDADRALQSLAQENAMLARELGRIQQRCTQWRDDCIVETERLEATLMRSRAANIVKETQMASLRESLEALHKRAAVWLTHEELLRRLSDLRARNRSLERELEAARSEISRLRCPGARGDATNDRPPVGPEATSADALAASHAGTVLCVGGRARQVPIYRDLVERRGGRFAHVEGAAVDGLPELARQLSMADVVILQAGYVCDGACRVVEAHCARSGTRCLRLDKACALGFERCLDMALSTASR